MDVVVVMVVVMGDSLVGSMAVVVSEGFCGIQYIYSCPVVGDT